MTERVLAARHSFRYISLMSTERREMADTIINDPSSYKICLICGSIVDAELSSCPDCFGYRFDTDPTHVADEALDMANNAPRAVSHLDQSNWED